METKSSQIIRVIPISISIESWKDFEVFKQEVQKKFALDIVQLFQERNESLSIYVEKKLIQNESIENESIENKSSENESDYRLVFCNNKERLQSFATKITNLLQSKSCKLKNKHSYYDAIILTFERTQTLNPR